MKEYYNLSQSAQLSYKAAKKNIDKRRASHRVKNSSGSDSEATPLLLPMPKCMCDDNPALKNKSDNKVYRK